MEKNPDKIVIVIAGPTAVGKTSLAIELAKHFQTEIISADSRQCFKELNIGVARPSVEELQQVPHHFINSHSIQEEVTAITFEQYALQKATALFKYHQVVVMVGGTGLYIKAFTDGLDLIPPINPAVRMEVIQSFEQHGVSWLQQQLQQKDPLYSEKGEMQNPQRMMRALEVVESTGQSVLSFRKGEKVKRDFSIIKIGVELPKEELHRNIHTRVDNMMKAGLQEEVKGLLSFRKLNALQTVGYAELFDWLDGNISLEKAMEQIKTATRQYAKRQMTWFKKDKELQWFSPVQINEIIEAIGLSRS
ncbi:MAG: tRNA (adenosine(37)-N6)-dimethylallyltransferase MiaA [Chitinophagaceae bacterium]|nr:tRNA (adenosine(37)-N6)-dimethylallyltransferase MiaA [Chitinophagaceae bacterium]MBK8300773.1 tRNA (adenosine(37)-N6)-dimethylallyltransferase MiaA [Chitinophagaceae bacterium]MBK9465730.1 tRNA (adenosine(37)-N6)-dimethylallyltransferase MiaA [Chitinophagaceae bacterium]MBK9661071.1 tRNA (adenosine(37)-N6)-dimethylallyltransferase MiaA [Chitinophagaceae bacterium]HQW44961.1 tRNA (adenosine(37)-N6)-dimethylallyltransferase MiaA [Chitinophagaceae bacterium]